MGVKLYLKQLEVGPMQNFIYLIGDASAGECVMIDPAWDVNDVLQTAAKDKMKVIAGLLTHTHYDHSNGVGDLLAKIDGPLFVHEKEAGFMKDFKNRIQKTADGFEIKVGAMKIRCLHTPGHTPGGQCFYTQGHLASGDTLFVDACGRCDLPGSDPSRMYESLQKLAQLDEGTVLLPGHDYGDQPTSTIGREKSENPYYRVKSIDDFLSFRG